jgi:hypothetical protein
MASQNSLFMQVSPFPGLIPVGELSSIQYCITALDDGTYDCISFIRQIFAVER